MPQSSRDATHTTLNYKHLYRITNENETVIERLTRHICFNTGVEFWDRYTNQWRPSIVQQSELIKIGDIMQ